MWSKGGSLPGWLEGSILVTAVLVVPIWLLTASASNVIITVMSHLTTWTLALITVLSLCDVAFCLQRRWAGRARGETKPALSGKVVDGVSDESGVTDVQLSLILPCYLPNEVDVIEETLDNLMHEVQLNANFQVVLVYNSPPIEECSFQAQELEKRLRARDKVVICGTSKRELLVKRCVDSRSKAENINFALGLCSGNVVGVLDADHLLEVHALSRVVELWTPATAVIQGSCYVRNYNRNLLTQVVAMEEALIFNVHHTGGSVWRGFAIFGGSNGYWRKDILASLLLKKDMLTEDIDVSLRALNLGSAVRHEPSIVSSELAPDTIRGLWRQRLRWAQGWFQCSYRHTVSLLGSQNVALQQKLGVVVMFFMREVWYYLLPASAVKALTITLKESLGAKASSLPSVNDGLPGRIAFFAFVATYTVELLISYALTPRSRRPSLPWLLVGIVCFLPFLYFLVLVGITAQFRELYGYQSWTPTTRPSAKREGKNDV